MFSWGLWEFLGALACPVEPRNTQECELQLALCLAGSYHRLLQVCHSSHSFWPVRQRTDGCTSALDFFIHSNWTTPHSKTMIQGGPEGAGFSALVRIVLMLYTLYSWPKFPHGLALMAETRQRNKWFPVLVWVLFHAKHDTRSSVKVVYLRGDRSEGVKWRNEGKRRERDRVGLNPNVMDGNRDWFLKCRGCLVEMSIRGQEAVFIHRLPSNPSWRLSLGVLIPFHFWATQTHRSSKFPHGWRRLRTGRK